MDILLVLRLLITLTFLILAAGGPYAIVQFRRFIIVYTQRHVALELRVAALEREIQEMHAAQNQEPKHL